MKGGHSRSGPLALDESARRRRSARRRSHVAAAVPNAATSCQEPAGLTPQEHEFWTYYAGELGSAGRLRPTTQGVLAAYCTASATIARLRRQIAAAGYCDVDQQGVKSALLPELRHWLNLARLLESDLLLSPASAMRAPQAPVAQTDAFAEFDAPFRPYRPRCEPSPNREHSPALDDNGTS